MLLNALYIDNILIACIIATLMTRNIETLIKAFKMEDLGESQTILEMDIHRNRNKMKLYLS